MTIRAEFNYPNTYRIGAGRAHELPAACTELGIQRPLLITDEGLAKLSWLTTIVDHVSEQKLALAVFSDVATNPSSKHIAAGLEAFKAHRADGCILIGGGSAMDVGKCVALLAHNPGHVFDYEDRDDNWKSAISANIVPSIAIPTTAGTGSEVGRAAVILDPNSKAKKIIFHPQLQPNMVLADPELTVGLPPQLTAATGMDAFAHCFEAYCAPTYHPMADGIALEGMRLIAENLADAFSDGGNLNARTHLLMAAAMGATAFQKGLGLIHALSHPVGGITGLHHGTANAIFQPYVMVHNRVAIENRCTRIAQYLGLGDRFEDLLTWFLEIREQLALPATLDGILDPDLISKIVPMAATDPSLDTNPKPCNHADIESVLRNALTGVLDR